MELSDTALSQIADCLRSTECRVRLLSLELTSLASVSPAVLLRFVRDVAPTDLVFRMLRGCTTEHFGPELCRFLVGRRFFSVSELVDAHSNNVALSLDDAILEELSASTFQIAAHNSITVDGLRSFVKVCVVTVLFCATRMFSAVSKCCHGFAGVRERNENSRGGQHQDEFSTPRNFFSCQRKSKNSHRGREDH
ncbi:hypothetical protein Aduo_002471 [Ancylostoma duodenale]